LCRSLLSTSSSSYYRPLTTDSLSFSSTARPPRPPLFPYTTLFRSIAERARGVLKARAGPGPELRTVPDRGHQGAARSPRACEHRSEEHTSELSHVSISYAVFCLKKKKTNKEQNKMVVRKSTALCKM